MDSFFKYGLLVLACIMCVCGTVFWANDEKDPEAGWCIALSFAMVCLYQQFCMNWG